MKLGLQLLYWGAQPTERFIELARRAEDLGFDIDCTAEAYGADALTPLAAIAMSTRRIRLGTAVLVSLGAIFPERQFDLYRNSRGARALLGERERAAIEESAPKPVAPGSYKSAVIVLLNPQGMPLTTSLLTTMIPTVMPMMISTTPRMILPKMKPAATTMT